MLTVALFVELLTVTVACAVTFPEEFVAVAVYVVVAVGLTDCVPPFGWRVYELPSVPVTVTDVALVAVTVRVDEDPDEIVVGFAVMVTVGLFVVELLTVTVVVAVVLPPVPTAVAV